jgi:hypothetical protein
MDEKPYEAPQEVHSDDVVHTSVHRSERERRKGKWAIWIGLIFVAVGSVHSRVALVVASGARMYRASDFSICTLEILCGLLLVLAGLITVATNRRTLPSATQS